MPNVYEIIRDHVTLSTRCVDRLYINGYIPTLQMGGHVGAFILNHLGKPVISPALLRPIHDRFASEVERLAARERIPFIRFERGQRKDDIVNEYRSRFSKPKGIVVIGTAQEKAWSFKATKRHTKSGHVLFDFSRQTVFVKHFYFYVQDPDWGPAFLKIGTYLPFPVKLCLNGHEWVKQQLRRERVPFEALDNGFLSCPQPERLQQVADSLDSTHVQAFFDRWSHHLPWPLSTTDRAAGYDHKLTIWQMEISLTQVFDRPLHGRLFFEEVIRDHLDLGRPYRVSLLFPTQLNKRTPTPPFGYRTRVVTKDVAPSIHVNFKFSHVKQYFKDGRALRTETTINRPIDFGCCKALKNFTFLRNHGDQVNRKLLEAERIAQHCSLSQDALDRLQTPTTSKRQRASAMRFGDPRVMALLHALCSFQSISFGFRHRDLRPLVASLLGQHLNDYSTSQMTYDLRRLRLKGLISRISGSHRYVLTTYGLKVSFFFSKLYLRLIRPAWAQLIPHSQPLASSLRQAFERLAREIDKLIQNARLFPPPPKLDSYTSNLSITEV